MAAYIVENKSHYYVSSQALYLPEGLLMLRRRWSWRGVQQILHVILPTKETRCCKNSQAMWSESRPQWCCWFAFRMLMGSTKVGHHLHASSFHYRSRGGDATTAISFVGGTPPVYSVQHDLILMSSQVDSRGLPPWRSLCLCHSGSLYWGRLICLHHPKAPLS